MIVLLKGWFSGSMVVFNCVLYEKRLFCICMIIYDMQYSIHIHVIPEA